METKTDDSSGHADLTDTLTGTITSVDPVTGITTVTQDVSPGTARLRITVNAMLDDETIDRFAAALARVFREILLSSASSAVESFPA